jgi:hypothetical protein
MAVDAGLSCWQRVEKLRITVINDVKELEMGSDGFHETRVVPEAITQAVHIMEEAAPAEKGKVTKTIPERRTKPCRLKRASHKVLAEKLGTEVHARPTLFQVIGKDSQPG